MTRVGDVAGAHLLALTAVAALTLAPHPAQAGTFDGVIEGLTGTTFNLTASVGYISTPDGNSIYTWGYGASTMQYPGPTLIVDEGDTVTVNLTNNLDVPVSIVFPAQPSEAVVTTGAPGLLTREALPGGGVSYTFTAANPGTYLYHSGTEPDLQVEMGLFGAIIVRPSTFGTVKDAYGHSSAVDDYDREYLFLFSEMDPRIHELVEQGRIEWVDTSERYEPLYWFINGRSSPDLLDMENVAWLPHQPYNCLPIMRAGERLLMREIGAGKQLHPLHQHGNHAQQLARDGRLLLDDDGNIIGPLFATESVVPGQTADFVFEWTGRGLGWDAYGTGPEYPHSCTPTDVSMSSCDTNPDDCHDPVSFEWCPDHGVPIPVTLPNQQNIAFGGFWSGSPYLGHLGSLPPGEGGLNPWGGFTFPWHSHAEKELLNNDIFPGGALTFVVVVSQDTDLP